MDLDIFAMTFADNFHPANFRKLDRVADKIQQDPLELMLIGSDQCAGRTGGGSRDPFGHRIAPARADHIFKKRSQGKRADLVGVRCPVELCTLKEALKKGGRGTGAVADLNHRGRHGTGVPCLQSQPSDFCLKQEPRLRGFADRG